ncbi:MAG: threonine/serine dehydratase [Polyangiaceae bacterium]|jgi:threonine dehydratase
MQAPITLDDVVAARGRIRPLLALPTAMRRYAALDERVGHGIRVWVKHENHLPTNAFKARNALSAMTNLRPEARQRGVVGATRGNHGMGLAFAGAELGIPVTICVPRGNNPEKNEAIRGYGATLVEEGRDYDESVLVAQRLVAERGMHIVHSTNDRDVIAGAATLTLEMIEQVPSLDAVVYAVGGGSQAVGGLVVLRALAPRVEAFGVQAVGASAIHDSWHARSPVVKTEARTFADGLATRGVYELTFESLRDGLAGFVAASEDALADACVTLIRTTHNLVEGAGAAGLAGLIQIAESGRLDGRNVGIVMSGANIDMATLRSVLARADGSAAK